MIDDLPISLEAARVRLAAKGLLKPGDSVSCRLPAPQLMLLVMQEDAGPMTVQCLHLDGSDDHHEPTALHRRLYAARPDVGAALIGRMPWSAALHATGGPMPGLFDEQLRHLGWRVDRLDSLAEAADLDRVMRSGGNAFAAPGTALCLGMTLERLVFNVELLEKCAKAYVLARVSGQRVRTIPWLVRWIATGRLRRDQRVAVAHHARGEFAPRVAGY